MENSASEREDVVTRIQHARTMRFVRGNILLQRGRFRVRSERKFDIAERLAGLRARFNRIGIKGDTEP
jgi:hypothetical protein